MTDETKRKRDELAEQFSKRYDFAGYRQGHHGYQVGFDAGYAEGQAEIERLKAKLSLAIATLEFVVKQSGSSTDYNLSARQTLAEIEGVE